MTLFHIYNRGNNSAEIFFEEKNYEFFKKKISKHLKPVCDVLAYCLMPNHFHLLVTLPSGGLKPSGGSSAYSEISKSMGIILSSYTQAINKAHNRTGSLFQQKTKFKEIKTNLQAQICMHYIHQNPVKANLVSRLEDWSYSSFNEYYNPNDAVSNITEASLILDLPKSKNEFVEASYSVIANNEILEYAEPPDGLESPEGAKRKKKIGLVLSGGGARGIAHLGIIKALEEHDVQFSQISGTSAGAIIGALYASGHSIDDIVKILGEIKGFKLFQPALSWKGILNMDVVERFLENYLPVDDFASLNIPLTVTATNLRTGQSEYFNSGKLRAVICASSCIPVLFNPVSLGDELYIDGGILNNLPVEPIRETSEVIIACHSNPVGDNFEAKNAKAVMERALMMAITQNVYNRRNLCDIFIEPLGLESYKVMDLSKSAEIFDIGYQYTKQKIETENLLEKLA